jgi:MFS family permease
MYFCQAYGWYFYISYLPGFLEEQHGVHPSSALGALYKGGPLWMGAIGCLLGGFLTDWFIRRTGNRKLGRRLFGIIGHCGCVVCFLVCGFTTTAFWFFLVISLAGFSSDITMASSWSLCQDIGRRHAAIVAGCMNMIGNLGGAVGAWVTGSVLLHTLDLHAAGLGLAVEQLSERQKAAGLMPGYKIAFLIFAAVHVIGVICWCRVDSTKPVVPEEPDKPAK